MRRIPILSLCCAAALLAGCSAKVKTEQPSAAKPEPSPVYFKVDPGTAGTVTGQILFKGKRPAPKVIDMSEEPACVEAHHGKASRRIAGREQERGDGKCFRLHKERFGRKEF